MLRLHDPADRPFSELPVVAADLSLGWAGIEKHFFTALDRLGIEKKFRLKFHFAGNDKDLFAGALASISHYRYRNLIFSDLIVDMGLARAADDLCPALAKVPGIRNDPPGFSSGRRSIKGNFQRNRTGVSADLKINHHLRNGYLDRKTGRC